jgi:HlyD family secretion protein
MMERRTVDAPDPPGRTPRAAVVVSLSIGIVVRSRAARAVGDRDLDSFRPRLDPVAATDGLQPGMTVWLPGWSAV